MYIKNYLQQTHHLPRNPRKTSSCRIIPSWANYPPFGDRNVLLGFSETSEDKFLLRQSMPAKDGGFGAIREIAVLLAELKIHVSTSPCWVGLSRGKYTDGFEPDHSSSEKRKLGRWIFPKEKCWKLICHLWYAFLGSASHSTIPVRS